MALDEILPILHRHCVSATRGCSKRVTLPNSAFLVGASPPDAADRLGLRAGVVAAASGAAFEDDGAPALLRHFHTGMQLSATESIAYCLSDCKRAQASQMSSYCVWRVWRKPGHSKN